MTGKALYFVTLTRLRICSFHPVLRTLPEDQPKGRNTGRGSSPLGRDTPKLQPEPD